MHNNPLNQEQFLNIFMYAHDIRQNSNHLTTKEMLQNLIPHIPNPLLS
ncbi:hypothetical protein [Bacillus altitudinis]|nr:hypothetical protein [Bacillus altitudinis]